MSAGAGERAGAPAARSNEMAALAAAIGAAGGMDHKLAVLLDGLADQIKAVSNDQNVQRLSRDLRAAAPSLAEAFRIAAGR